MIFAKDKLIVLVGEFFDRFNFYGIQALLLLYLIKTLHISNPQALTIFAAYSTIGFISPLVGGYLVDIFSLHRPLMIMLGIILVIIGDTLLLSMPQASIHWGMIIVISGIGLFKSNNAVLFGQLFQRQPEQKATAYTYFYGVMNAGAIIGPLFYGNIDLYWGWRYGFTASIIGFSLTFILYVIRLKSLMLASAAIMPTANNVPKYNLIFIIIGFVGYTYLCMKYDACLSGLLIGLFAIIAYLVFRIGRKLKSKIERHNLLVLMVAMLYGVVFYALSMQIASSLLLYLNSQVNTRVWGFFIPPEDFMSILSLLILTLTPVAARIWHGSAETAKNILSRCSTSIYLAATGFLLIALSSVCPVLVINLQLLLVLLGLAFLALGELAIGPMVTSSVSNLAPLDSQGIFMGIWYVSTGYSAYIASVVTRLINPHYFFMGFGNIYTQTFVLIAGVTLITALLMMLVNLRLIRHQ